MNCLADRRVDYANEIQFTSSHLHEISSSDVEKLNFDVFREVVRFSHLKMESKDWLYETISKRNSSDFRYFENA
jgi:hypothetical protein